MLIAIMFHPAGGTDAKSAMVQVMAWHQVGAKSLPELMMPLLYQWVNICLQEWGLLTSPGFV